MKIKEFLNKEELEFAKDDEGFLCTDELDCMLMDHMDELEVSDYINFRMAMELSQMSFTLIRIGRAMMRNEQSNKNI